MLSFFSSESGSGALTSKLGSHCTKTLYYYYSVKIILLFTLVQHHSTEWQTTVKGTFHSLYNNTPWASSLLQRLLCMYNSRGAHKQSPTLFVSLSDGIACQNLAFCMGEMIPALRSNYTIQATSCV